MAVSNLRIGLIRRYKDWSGVRKLLEQEIEDISKAYETLDAKRERSRRVSVLLSSVENIMSELAPAWNPANETPTRKYAWKTPFESAAVTRWTLDILREAKEPLRSRAIAEMIMTRNDLSLDDRDIVERVRQTVDNTLRKKLANGLVESVDSWPVRWSIKDLGDRPQS